MSLLSRRTILTALSLSAISAAQPLDARKTFTIIGKVKHPGTYGLRSDIRIVRAIAIAGGFVDFAQLHHIQVIRGGQRITFDYILFEKGESMESNIRLVGDDTIEVP